MSDGEVIAGGAYTAAGACNSEGCVWSSIGTDKTCDPPIWKTSSPPISGKEEVAMARSCLVRRRYIITARTKQAIITIGNTIASATMVAQLGFFGEVGGSEVTGSDTVSLLTGGVVVVVVVVVEVVFKSPLRQRTAIAGASTRVYVVLTRPLLPL